MCSDVCRSHLEPAPSGNSLPQQPTKQVEDAATTAAAEAVSFTCETRTPAWHHPAMIGVVWDDGD